MKKSLYILFSLLGIFKCITSHAALHFPDTIQTQKTANHVRVGKTNAWAIFPPAYKFISELSRYQKNDNLYIQVLDNPSNDYYKGLPNVSRKAIEGKGAKVDVYQTIRFNQYDAIYMEGPSKFAGETKITLIAGDTSFVLIVAGVCKTDDIAGKKELQEILKTIFYDKNGLADPTAMADFEFNHTITGFQFSMNMSGFLFYAENGKADAKNVTPNGFLISTLPAVSEENTLTFIYQTFGNFARNGFYLKNQEIQRTIINNQDAFVVETPIRLQGKSGMLYMVLITTPEKVLYFSGTDYTSDSRYLEKYRQTAATIKGK